MNRPITWAFLTIFILISANYVFFYTFRDEIFSEDYIVLKNKFNAAKKTKDLGYIFLGDSTILSGFVPANSPLSGYNFATPCPSNFEIYHLAQNIDFKTNKIKKVFLSLHFLSLTNQEHCFEHIILNYNIISVSDFLPAANAPGFLDYVSYQSKPRFLFNLLLLKFYLHPEQFALINTKALLSGPTKLVQFKGYNSEKSLFEFPFENPPGNFKQTFKIHPFQDFYLNKLLELLKERKVEVIFVHPLYYEGYRSRISDEFKKSIDQFFSKLMSTYHNLKYDSSIEFRGKDYFNDALHPSQKGAEHFSRKIYEQAGGHERR